MESQSHTEVVGAPIQACFDAIVNFARYPEWFSAITAAEILETDPATNRWTVRFELNMLVKTITYTLAYEAEPPTSIQWRLVEGDVNDIEGRYDLDALDADVTEATCHQSIDVGFWIPGPIKRTFEKSALMDSMRELKSAVEADV